MRILLMTQIMLLHLVSMGFLLSLPASATVILVDSTNTDQTDLDACTITSAFSAATTRTGVGTCPAGSGKDTIVLPNNAIFEFARGPFGYSENPSVVPLIDSDITLVGNGSTLRSTLPECSPGNMDYTYFRFFTVVQSGHLSILGATLIGGCMANGYPGGSILVSHGSLDLQNTTIQDSWSEANGGAIYSINGSTLDIRHCVFKDNVGRDGGAIYSDSSGSIRGSYFTRNTASSGGAVYTGFGTNSIVNSTFDRNISWRGALRSAGTTDISFSTFSGNVGGALDAGSSTRVLGSIFTGGPGGTQSQTCFVSSTKGFEVLGPSFADDPRCEAMVVVDRSDLRMGEPGMYGGFSPTLPLLPGSVAINSIESCYGFLGFVAEDQRGAPRPDEFPNGCDAGAYEFDGADYSPPMQMFGAGNILISFEDRVSEYTREGMHVRDIWQPQFSPADVGIRGVAADGLNSFGAFLGTFNPSLGHYELSSDGWTFASDPSWAVWNSSPGAVARAGSRWFVVDNLLNNTNTGSNSTAGVVVFENGVSIGEILSATEVYDVSVGANGLVYLLESYLTSAPRLRWFDPQTLQELGALVPFATAGVEWGTKVTADRLGNIYLGGSALAPLVRLDSSGSLLAQTDCIVPGNSRSCKGSISNLAFSADDLLFVGSNRGYLIAVNADFSSGFSAALSDFVPDQYLQAYVAPLPLDMIFTSSFDD